MPNPRRVQLPPRALFLKQGDKTVKTLIVILGILAAIALAATLCCGLLRLAYRLLEKAVDAVCHEMMMRPRERYYRMSV